MGKVVDCVTLSQNEAIKLVSNSFGVGEAEANKQLNKDLKVKEAWLKSTWGHKPTLSKKGKQKKAVVVYPNVECTA
ncbi:hypothetical protein Scep_007557 [Stephania cephalantha]|uniref:Uncharacterized protein n=1 Tax=Stephania cephalantha TaxID=152367 RepID=A0AAP0KCR8_9MAGN